MNLQELAVLWLQKEDYTEHCSVGPTNFIRTTTTTTTTSTTSTARIRGRFLNLDF